MTKPSQPIKQQWQQNGETTLRIGQLDFSRDLATDFENIQEMIRLPNLVGFQIQMGALCKPMKPFFMTVSPNLPQQEEFKVVQALLALASCSHACLTVTASNKKPQNHVPSLSYQEAYQLMHKSHFHC